ncbi:Ig-like domain repeat protein [Microbacteriaceae bacterium K1510]|nr:Ig-like domain repeat protein [Microbacteriaceae bacterium K1510]
MTISGSGFTGTTSVMFGGTNALSFNVVNDSQLVATTPAGTGTVDVTVSTTGGSSTTTSAYTYLAGTLLGVTASATPSTVARGGNVTFSSTISVTGGTATSASWTIDLPTGLSVGSVSTASGWTCSIGSVQVICSKSSVLPGDYAFLLDAQVAAGAASGPATATVTASASNATTALNTATVSVVLPAASISLVSAPSPSITGQTVTMTATVTGASGSPTGSVTFQDGATTLGTATLAGGVATFQTNALSIGSHSLTAVYGGDSNYAGNTSSPVTQTVNAPSATTTTLTSSANPSTIGQPVTFTAHVTSSGGTPTGTVTFWDGATMLGNGTLAGGAATFQTSALASGPHTLTAVYGGDTSFAGSTSTPLAQTINALPATTTTLTSSANPSILGQTVTFTAHVTSGSGTPTGTVTFYDGATTLGTGTLAAGVATFQTGALASGARTITALYGGDANFAGSTSPTLAQTVNATSPTTTTLTSSANPSAPGQAVTFTARVTAGNGTPTGSVTFSDGAVALGTATLASGTATFTTAALANGAHSITAQYLGVTGFAASTSSVLTQTVAIPADSIKLRAMQIAATKVVAQNAGQAIAGAIGDAIDEGFSNGGALITPSGSSVRFNFAADPDRPDSASGARKESRINDAFAAIDRNIMPAKARPATSREPKDWLLWADVRGSGIDRWSGAGGAQAQLYGWQVNTLIGLTHRLTPSFLIGIVGGYETFDYTSNELNGKLKGNGWTIGSYLGWKFTPTVRFDLALAYSGIGYDGSAGTAQGSFDGHRWLLSTGFTGQYKTYGFDIEPSAKVYALWEHENAYTDTLGTRQGDRDFSTGRASGGVKLAYPVAWTDDLTITPYFGLYGDYYFTRDNAGDVDSATTPALASTPLIDGWSARTTGGLTARFAGGGALALGAELGGIGSDVEIWTFRARGNVPF